MSYKCKKKKRFPLQFFKLCLFSNHPKHHTMQAWKLFNDIWVFWETDIEINQTYFLFTVSFWPISSLRESQLLTLIHSTTADITFITSEELFQCLGNVCESLHSVIFVCGPELFNHIRFFLFVCRFLAADRPRFSVHTMTMASSLLMSLCPTPPHVSTVGWVTLMPPPLIPGPFFINSLPIKHDLSAHFARRRLIACCC